MTDTRSVNARDEVAVTEAAQAGWWAAYRADFMRYRQHRAGASALELMLTEQGLWALLQYRMASGLTRSGLPKLVKSPLLLISAVLQKTVEIVTGIAIPCRATIGPGLYIGHFGNIIFHEDVVLGHTCNVSQGVTIGSSGRGARRGVPTIGNRVYLATNAVVVGRITVGSGAVVAANSLVTRDVPAGTTVMGVPAQVVKHLGSDDYIESPPVAGIAKEPNLSGQRHTASILRPFAGEPDGGRIPASDGDRGSGMATTRSIVSREASLPR